MKRIILFLIVLFVQQIVSAQAPMSVVNKTVPIPFEKVENQPIFPGGNNEFTKFIGKNFRVPDVEDFSGGILKVSFVIEVNGSIGDIKIINDLGHGTGDEIKRVLSLCPKWTPGDQDGKPARVLFTLPVTIRN